MSQEETLRLAAQIVNQASGPLKDMQRSLRALSAEVKGTHRQGVAEATAHTKSIHELRGGLQELSRHVVDVTRPAMAALGIAGFSAAGGLAAAVMAVKNFAGASTELSHLAGETSLTVNRLRELDAVAKRVGSSPDAMRSGLAAFAEQMEQLRRQRGTLHDFFATNYDRNVQGFGNMLSHIGSNDEALGRALGFLDRIENPIQRKYFLSATGLPPELGRLTGAEFKKTFEQIRTDLGSLSEEEIKAGKQADIALFRLDLLFGRLKEKVGAGLAPALTELADALRDFVDGSGITDAAKTLNTLREALADLRNDEPVNWEKLIGLANLDKTGEVFVATWKARIAAVRAFFHLGSQGEADSTEAERLRLLQKDFPEKARREREAGKPVMTPNGVQWVRNADTGSGHTGPFTLGEIHSRLGDLDEAIERGSHKGIIEGLREWFQGLSTGETPAGGGRPLATSAASLPSVVRSAAERMQGLFAGKGAGLTSSQRESAGRIMAGLQARGFSREQAAAIVGNLTAKSALRPGNVNSIGAYGLEQWLRSRKQGLFNFARSTGRDARDLEAQLDWIKFESTGGSTKYGSGDESAAYRKALAGGDVARMAMAFGAGVERPSSSELASSLGRRMRAAADAYRGAATAMPHFSLDQIQRAVRGSAMMGGKQTVEGDASLRIALEGFPRGTKTDFAASGMFRSVILQRGRFMTEASDVG